MTMTFFISPIVQLPDGELQAKLCFRDEHHVRVEIWTSMSATGATTLDQIHQQAWDRARDLLREAHDALASPQAVR